MGESFTVKLDLSSVRQPTTVKDIYILMVDPKKMKVIYEFKEWVRFLFSMDYCIRLVHEGAALHDMEDINILSLLKTVRAEECPPPCSHKVHDLLLEKFNKFENWQGMKVPRILADRIDLNSSSMSSNINSQTSEKTFDTKTTESEAVNSVPTFTVENVTMDRHIVENENQPPIFQQERRVDTSITELKGRDCFTHSEQFDSRRTDEFFTPVSHEGRDSLPYKGKNLKNNEIHNVKISNKQEIGLQQEPERKILTQSTEEQSISQENMKTPEPPVTCNIGSQKRNRNGGKGNITRPFYISDTLNALRVKEEVADELEPLGDSSYSPDVENAEGDYKNQQSESVEQKERRLRKRTRKHKSKSKAENQINSPKNDCSSCHTVNSSFQSASSDGNPKHIRFCDDFCTEDIKNESVDEAMVYSERIETVDDHISNSNDFPGEERNVNIQHMRDLLDKKLKNSQVGLTQSSDLNVEHGIKGSNLPSSYGNQRLQSKNYEEAKNDSEIVHTEYGFERGQAFSPKNSLDELSNLRKKFSNPVVFTRFS